jgi:hypothetical protein
MAVICDIDNTLIRNGIYPIQSAIDFINKQSNVYLITGRPEVERVKTIATLKKYGVRFLKLLMNRLGNTPELMYQSKHNNAVQVMGVTTVTAAYDDNPRAQLIYRKLGIPVTQDIKESSNPMAVPANFQAAAARKVAKKRAGGGIDPDAGPGDPAGPMDAQDTAKKKGGMNAGLKAYLASHGKGASKTSTSGPSTMPPGMMG